MPSHAFYALCITRLLINVLYRIEVYAATQASCFSRDIIHEQIKWLQVQGRRIRQNIQIDVNRDVEQVLTPRERIHKFHCTSARKMRPRTRFRVNLKISLTNFICKIIVNILRILSHFFHSQDIQHLWTADIDTVVCLFVHCIVLLAMATPAHKQEVKVIWQKAPHGGPIPRLGVTPEGRKLYHCFPGGRVSY